MIDLFGLALGLFRRHVSDRPQHYARRRVLLKDCGGHITGRLATRR